MAPQRILAAVSLCCLFSSVNAFGFVGSARPIPSTATGVSFSRTSASLLRAEEAPSEEGKGEGDLGEAIGELPDEDATDILNSPAFLRRKVDVLQSDVEKIDAEIDEANKCLEENKLEWGPKLDDLQREYLNIQDRMSKQSREGEGVATIEVARKMLEVLDNYDRAFGQVTAETDEQKEVEASYVKTKEMILAIFDNLDIKEVETVGIEFDYEIHQAVLQRPSEYEENIVCEELAKGFVLGDKLIRAAMVSVSAGTY